MAEIRPVSYKQLRRKRRQLAFFCDQIPFNETLLCFVTVRQYICASDERVASPRSSRSSVGNLDYGVCFRHSSPNRLLNEAILQQNESPVLYDVIYQNGVQWSVVSYRKKIDLWALAPLVDAFLNSALNESSYPFFRNVGSRVNGFGHSPSLSLSLPSD